MESAIKKRTLTLQNVCSQAQLNSAAISLSEMEGILDVSTRAINKLVVEYNLIKVNLFRIETLLEDLRIPASKSFFQKFKRGWIHFTEENEVQNLQSVPLDCCTPREKK
jgi:hypothetical protein